MISRQSRLALLHTINAPSSWLIKPFRSSLSMGLSSFRFRRANLSVPSNSINKETTVTIELRANFSMMSLRLNSLRPSSHPTGDESSNFSPFFALAALYAALTWIGISGAALLLVALVPLGAMLGFRLLRHLLRQIIWRLRNRLIVTYIFIAVVPIMLIVALTAVGTWIVVGQVAAYLISAQLERRAASLEVPARLIAAARPQDRATLIGHVAPELERTTPGLEVLVAGDQTLRYPPGGTLEAPLATLRNYTGYAFRKGRYYCVSIASNGGTHVAMAAPIDSALMGSLVPNIGVVNLFGPAGGPPGNLAEHPIAGTLPPAYNALDFRTTWMARPVFALWDTPGQTAPAALIVQTRPSAVLNAVFSQGAEEAQTTQVAFVVITLLLLIVELAALVIGVSLTRTITNSVHGLYEGTARIAQGDFAWRIPVKGNDQLPPWEIPSTICPRASKTWWR